MDSFWAQQGAKNQQSIDELCTDVTFSNRLRACDAIHQWFLPLCVSSHATCF